MTVHTSDAIAINSTTAWNVPARSTTTNGYVTLVFYNGDSVVTGGSATVTASVVFAVGAATLTRRIGSGPQTISDSAISPLTVPPGPATRLQLQITSMSSPPGTATHYRFVFLPQILFDQQ